MVVVKSRQGKSGTRYGRKGKVWGRKKGMTMGQVKGGRGWARV